MLATVALLSFLSSVSALPNSNFGRIISVGYSYFSEYGWYKLNPSTNPSVSTNKTQRPFASQDLNSDVLIETAKTIRGALGVFTIKWFRGDTSTADCSDTLYLPFPAALGTNPGVFCQSEDTDRTEEDTLYKSLIEKVVCNQKSSGAIKPCEYTICLPSDVSSCLVTDHDTGAVSLDTLDFTDPMHRWFLDVEAPQTDLSEADIARQVDLEYSAANPELTKDDEEVDGGDGSDGTGSSSGPNANTMNSDGSTAGGGTDSAAAGTTTGNGNDMSGGSPEDGSQ
ncbi:hypothetical protein B0H11DRAFT_656493 [Mycena galericulata]|nr:hypothetical protein B0H11DRAFT_656493 [Mycena galericulata]